MIFHDIPIDIPTIFFDIPTDIPTISMIFPLFPIDIPTTYTTIFLMLNPTFPNSQPRPGLQNKERMVPQLLALGRWTGMCCGWWGYH